jgi:hypothetical protein
MSEKPELEMTFDINILEHLGLKMYTSLPAVIAEYVANAWDAGARVAKVSVPTEDSATNDYAVAITDDGRGMAVDDVNKMFLIVGRPKREKEGETIEVRGKKRTFIGRKGIGKLAGFGIAGEVCVTTKKHGQFVSFTLDYDAMKAEATKAEKNETKVKYLPTVGAWGKTGDPNGTEVVLKRLKRVQPPNIGILRKNLARRFSILDPQYDFKVEINGDAIHPSDRELLKTCQYTWTIDNEIVLDGKPWAVSGWIGTKAATVSDEFERGVVIMCRGKLVQTPTLFDLGGTGFTGLMATAYLVGELSAEFLDADTDEVGTGRSSVIWEGEKGNALREWGTKRLKQICAQWVDKRTETKLAVIKDEPVYKLRIENLPPTERGVVDGLLKKYALKEDVTPESIKDIASFLAEGAEYKGFIDLVKAIDDSDPTNVHAVMKFLKEWEILDAVEMARIVEGRLHAIDKFQTLIDSDAKEIPDIHNFLVDNPWLLDPTWNYIDDEIRYSDLLKNTFPDPSGAVESDRRIDFLCLGYGNTLNVIEIKRPSKHLGVKDLRQLQDYVNFMKARKGTGERSYDEVLGYIVGGSLQRGQEVHQMKEDWKKIGMYVSTFEEMRSTAVKANKRFVDVIRRKADRTKDLRVIESHDRLRKAFESQQDKQK